MIGGRTGCEKRLAAGQGERGACGDSMSAMPMQLAAAFSRSMAILVLLDDGVFVVTIVGTYSSAEMPGRQEGSRLKSKGADLRDG